MKCAIGRTLTNKEYEAWAEEQIKNWSGYLSFQWRENKEHGEKYALIETEDGLDEGYHYNPE